MKTAAFFFSLLHTSIKASISRRGAFLIETGLMIGNNLIFFSMWWIFFRQFKEVGGWQLNDMIVLMVIGLGGYGLMLICFGGVRNLSRIILNGDLDPFMTQPKPILLHIAGSKSFSKGWGNLMTSAILLVIGGIADPLSLLLIAIGILCATLIFTGFNIVAHSLPFWMGAVEGLSRKYCDALFLFALYPTNIYSGVLQIVMFTLIPAGLISYLPLELVRNFTWLNLLLLIASSVAFMGVAICFFNAGLKRYESGNKFGIRH